MPVINDAEPILQQVEIQNKQGTMLTMLTLPAWRVEIVLMPPVTSELRQSSLLTRRTAQPGALPSRADRGAPGSAPGIVR